MNPRHLFIEIKDVGSMLLLFGLYLGIAQLYDAHAGSFALSSDSLLKALSSALLSMAVGAPLFGAMLQDGQRGSRVRLRTLACLPVDRARLAVGRYLPILCLEAVLLGAHAIIDGNSQTDAPALFATGLMAFYFALARVLSDTSARVIVLMTILVGSIFVVWINSLAWLELPISGAVFAIVAVSSEIALFVRRPLPI